MDAHLDPRSTTFCCSPCLLPPACPHRGHLFTTGASLVELGSGSITWPGGAALRSGHGSPIPQESHQVMLQPQGRRDRSWEPGTKWLLSASWFLDYKLRGAGGPRAVFITLGLRDSSTLTFLGQTLSLERSGSEAPHSPWTGDQVEGSGGHSAGALGDTPRCKPPFRALQGHSPQKG